MPRKIRDLIQDLRSAGFEEPTGAVTLSGKAGDYAKPYQERQVRRAIEEVQWMKLADRYHKWVEWSEEDGTYLGRCPDLITGIHGENPIRLFAELYEVVEEVISHFETEGRPLPPPRTRPMQEVA